MDKHKKVRAGHRSHLKKLIKEVNQPSTITEDRSNSLIKILEEKLTIFRTLNEEILSGIDEEETILIEIEESSHVSEDIQETISLLKRNLVLLKKETQSNQSENNLSCNSSFHNNLTKLPKIQLKKFDGNILNWTSFWDTFKAVIHTREEMSLVEKYTYLKSLLTGPAEKSIAGLELTSCNYETAIQILIDRFGNNQKLITSHLDALINYDQIHNCKDVILIRNFYDHMVNHVRALENLGKKPDQYGELFLPILMSKLPEEIRLKICANAQEWTLPMVLNSLKKEVEIRERCENTKLPVKSSPSQVRPTTATFMSGTLNKNYTTTRNCIYCGQNHFSNLCQTVTDINERKNIIKRDGRCFVCLGTKHIASNCTSQWKCKYCGKRHHFSICVKNNKNIFKSSETSSTNQQNITSEISPPDNTEHVTFQCNAETGSSILLQTAKAIITSDQEAVQSCILLDCGSQRSYITKQLKDKLKLKVITTKNIEVNTFGNISEDTTVEVVNVNIKTKFECIKMSAYVVPQICSPLKDQNTKDVIHHYKHLQKIYLANYTGETDQVVDVLIGSDYYWKLVYGKIKTGKFGPTAIKTKLGWVLSGPKETSFNNGASVHNFVINMSLQENTDNLEKGFHKFRSLESVGINPQDDSPVYENLKTNITFDGNMYKVNLPWKEHHPVLLNNYELSLNRFKNLLKRLNKTPDVLIEYDRIIKDQLATGIIEQVDKSQDISNTLTHYIPHHPVIKEERKNSVLWWEEPPFLKSSDDVIFEIKPGIDENEIPVERTTELKDIDNNNTSLITIENSALNVNSIMIDCKRNSSYKKLLRVTAYVIKFVQQIKCHENVLHNGVKESITELRTTFWTIRERQFVKKLIHKCFKRKRKYATETEIIRKFLIKHGYI